MWFKTYGFHENPFKITPKPEFLVGYEEQELKAREAITSGDILVITGPTGYGKTTMLRKLEKWAAKQKYRTVYFDCTYSKSEEIDFKKLLTVNSLLGLRKRLPKKKDRLVLFLDEVQRLNKDKMEELKYFYDSERVHAIAMSTISYLNVHESMRTRVAETVKLCNLSAHDIREMIIRRLKTGKNPFSPDGIEEIALLSSGNPRSALINAEKVCKELHTSFPEGNIGEKEVFYVIKGEKRGSYRPVIITDLNKKEPENPESVQIPAQNESVIATGAEEQPEPIQEDIGWAWELRSLSPLQKEIVKVLAESGRPLTYEEVSAATKAGKGSVAKQLSRLALVSDSEMMKKKGIKEPVVVKTVVDGKSAFELVEKYRRLLARE